MSKAQFNFKVEDLPLTGELVLSSYRKDKAAFTAFSSDYDNGFEENASTMLQQVNEVISPRTITAQRSQVTAELHEVLDSSLVTLDQIERYCELSGKELKVKKSDLKFPDIRNTIHARNSDGFFNLLGGTMQLLAPNLAVLAAKGYTPQKQQQLAALQKRVYELNKRQKDLLNDRRRLTDDNMDLLNEFWVLVKGIMRTGRVLFKDQAVNRAEYTQTEVLKRVRILRKNKEGGNGEVGKTN